MAASTAKNDEGRKKPLSIAIAGAGIAGLSTAIALSRLLPAPDVGVDVHLYDKASALREIGASIALGPNGLRSLEKLGVGEALEDEVAFRGPGTWPMIYRHWKTNEVISIDEFKNVPERKHQTARFARAHLHQCLLRHVDPARIHLGKKTVAVEDDDEAGGVVLKFADGTEARADLLVGADGINSGVRKFFVPKQKLGWTTQVAYRAVFDASHVEGIPDLPEDSTHWWGSTGNVFASRLGKGQFTTVGMTHLDPDDPKNKHLVETARWNNAADINEVRELFKDWHPLIRALFAATPPASVRIYPNLAITAPLPAYTFLGGRVVLVGDAAHPHGGAFATGGSLAIDDAFALGLALRTVVERAAGQGEDLRKGEVLRRATAIYEKVRRPHTTRLLEVVHRGVEASKERLRRGRVESDEELRERTGKRVDTSWLHEYDVEAEVGRVLVEEGLVVAVAGSVEARL